jgi:PTH1 family peptidyl-tRNA hydrolase
MISIVGLGNPGEIYEKNRHNAGRLVLEWLAKKHDFSEWKDDVKLKALVSKGELGGKKVQFILPNNFMNNSGTSVAPVITNAKELDQLVVVYDDLDIALGNIKISFDRSSGGHNGVESIIKKVKSQKFSRIRVGICPVTPTGKMKPRPGGDDRKDFLLKDFKEPELAELKKAAKRIGEALEMMITEGRAKAMTLFN